MRTEDEIRDKLRELEREYNYMTPDDDEYIYLPEQINILRWVLGGDY